jgi:DNA polymerase I
VSELASVRPDDKQVPSAKAVLDLLGREKLLQCFGPILIDKINPVTGRLHCRFIISGAKAGRFTANTSNLQQLPSRGAKEFRECVVAASGCVLVGCDWDQVELRAIAWVSRDPAMTAVYVRGRDLHTENAAAFAAVPLEEMTPEQRKDARNAAKAVSFGSIYGIGATSLAEDAFVNYGVDITVAEAEHRLDSFFRRFSRMSAWRNENADICCAQGFVRIGCGRVVEKIGSHIGSSAFLSVVLYRSKEFAPMRCCRPSAWRGSRLIWPVSVAG